jgi:hypothetical protein
MRRLLLLAALPIALMGCGSSNDNTPTVVSLAGTWNLTTANGTALPFTISNTAGTKIELLSASVVVGSTGAFTGTESIRTTVNGTATNSTLPLAGTISVSGTLVTVTLTGSIPVSGTLASTTQFSYTDPTTGAAFVFVKQ